MQHATALLALHEKYTKYGPGAGADKTTASESEELAWLRSEGGALEQLSGVRTSPLSEYPRAPQQCL